MRRPSDARSAPGRGYTLIELAVALVIGIVVLLLLWTLVTTMTRSFASSRDLLSSLQGAHLLVEYLKNDLAGCYYEAGTRPLETSQDFADLSFYVFEPGDNPKIDLAQSQATLEKISYHFDPKTSQVYRNGKPFSFARFEEVVFYFKPPDFEATPEKVYGNYVTLRVTCASEATIEINRGKSGLDRTTKNVVTLITSIGVAQKASQEIWPAWNRPDDPATVVR